MKILHLSDLHFGTELPPLIPALISSAKTLQPDLTIISGDLTQRARASQFRQTVKFLTQLPAPILSVPGNHDISLYNPFERLLFPFWKYQHWIGKRTANEWKNDEIAILGLNSVTPFKGMGGFITDKQLNNVATFFENQPHKIKMVVMHHNLIQSERHRIINDADKILSVFGAAGVNLVLGGHIHLPKIELLHKPYLNHALYIITAGTAISHRTSAPNSFNVIDLSQNTFTLSVYNYAVNAFIKASENAFTL